VSIALTRQIIRRLETQHLRRPIPAPVTVGLLAITDLDLPQFARQLAAQLARYGRVGVVDAAAIDGVLGVAGLARRDDADAGRRVALALDGLEADHDFLLLVGDADAGAWTWRCIRHSDELLLVADAAQPPAVHAIEQACLAERPARAEAAEILVLAHSPDATRPRNARVWLARRPVSGHINIRPQLERDMARLARLVSRRSIGLVFGGGGARGFAHLGIWRALRARGVDIDFVGGTSIGAAMAALVAVDPPVDRAIDVARTAFSGNPTGDYNLLPLMSLIKGRRVREAVARSFDALVGGPIDIEDLWKGFYCVASNYSQGCEQRLIEGDLGRALLASMAIPGALPPVVHDGDLLCDGGTFNNFPVDVMRDVRGVGTVIGVDLGARNPRRLEFEDVPGSWTLLVDRLLRGRKRRFRLPSLSSYLLNITILYSTSRQQETRRLTDIYFNPPLHKVGLLQWGRFGEIVDQGEQYAAQVLSGLDDQQRAALGIDARVS
jgi:NTE family protein